MSYFVSSFILSAKMMTMQSSTELWKEWATPHKW